MLVEDTASVPVWSPDGRFVAFFREAGTCTTFCRHQLFIVPAEGGKPHPVGPELVEPSDRPNEWWPGLAWLPEPAPVVVAEDGTTGDDPLELQRCVDIWNRAGMLPSGTGAVNVSLVADRCQVMLRSMGNYCSQKTELPYRYFCPNAGGGLRLSPPEYRVWNAHGADDGKLSLFDPPTGPRLPLPKAPPYPMLDGCVVPFGKDGEPLANLELTETAGVCYGTGPPDGYPVAYPDGYPAYCWWGVSGSENCFMHPGRLAVGDIVLCPQEADDPMRFIKVKVTELD